MAVGTWHDPDLGRPIAAPLEQCAELLGIDLAPIHELAAKVEPYVHADGTRIWSLMQLERQLRPEAYGRRRGGYLDRRQNRDRRCIANPRRPQLSAVTRRFSRYCGPSADPAWKTSTASCSRYSIDLDRLVGLSTRVPSCIRSTRPGQYRI